MKIGVVASSVTHRGGGVSEAVRGQCVALARRGVRVHVFAPDDGTSYDTGPQWRGVEVSILPTVWTRFAWAPSLEKSLVEADLDLVHLHGLWNAVSFSVLRWAEVTGRPVVISPHGMLDRWATTRSRMKKWVAWSLFERRNTQNASCFHALNKHEAEAIRARGISAPVLILPNGVDLPIMQPKTPTCVDRRRILLFLGRLHPKKGLLETFEAWREFKKLYPKVANSWKLTIAGWGDEQYNSELHKYVLTHGLSDDITFAGPVFGADKERILREADAFVLASHSEGLPMAVLEAWSYGLPVLMTEACNLSEGFEVGAACRISTNPSEIARTFSGILGNAKRLDLMGRHGRALTAERFSWDFVASDLAQNFELIICNNTLKKR